MMMDSEVLDLGTNARENWTKHRPLSNGRSITFNNAHSPHGRVASAAVALTDLGRSNSLIQTHRPREERHKEEEVGRNPKRAKTITLTMMGSASSLHSFDGGEKAMSHHELLPALQFSLHPLESFRASNDLTSTSESWMMPSSPPSASETNRIPWTGGFVEVHVFLRTDARFGSRHITKEALNECVHMCTLCMYDEDSKFIPTSDNQLMTVEVCEATDGHGAESVVKYLAMTPAFKHIEDYLSPRKYGLIEAAPVTIRLQHPSGVESQAVEAEYYTFDEDFVARELVNELGPISPPPPIDISS